MRIGTAFAQQNAMSNINDRASNIDRVQSQLSTGRRIQSPADDPAAAAEASRLQGYRGRISAETRMLDYTETSLMQADGALSDSVDTLQTIRDMMVQAINGPMSPEDRKNIAVNVEALRDRLLGQANVQDGRGSYIFAGPGSKGIPFERNAATGVVEFKTWANATTAETAGATAPNAMWPNAGKPANQQAGLDYYYDKNVNGERLFIGDASDDPTGNVFTVLDNAVAQLKDPAATTASLQATFRDTVTSMDHVLDKVGTTRADVGAQMSSIDARKRLLQSGDLQVTSRLSDLQDTNYASASSEMAKLNLGREAALRSYAMIQRVSLFSYL